MRAGKGHNGGRRVSGGRVGGRLEAKDAKAEVSYKVGHEGGGREGGGRSHDLGGSLVKRSHVLNVRPVILQNLKHHTTYFKLYKLYKLYSIILVVLISNSL